MSSAQEQLVVPGHVERHALDEYAEIGIGSTLANGRYWVLGRLGGGACVDIVQAIDSHVHNGEDVAIKSFKEHSPQVEAMNDREFNVHTTLQGAPNIVPIVDEGVHDDYGSPQRYLTMPLAKGTLLDRGPLATAELARAGLAIVQAVRAVHDIGMLYRDPKPDNVLWHANGYWLADFGSTTPIGELNTRGPIGSLGTMAPETFKEGVRLDTPTDVYGIGGTLYAAASGQLPIPLERNLDLGEQQRHYRIAQDQRERPPSVKSVAHEIDDELAEIIDSCLPRDASKRIMIHNLERALETLAS